MAFQATPAQRAAIDTRDRSFILSAAAGSGKTAVLTQRVISALTDPVSPLSLSRLLAVTFTESAAAEMRSRISAALAKVIQEEGGDESLAKELRLLPTCDISTIDAYCHRILRRYGTHRIPEGFRVADEAEAENCRIDLMEDVIEAGYAGTLPDVTGEEFASLSDRIAGLNQERNLSELFLRLYGKLRTYEKGISSLEDFAREYLADSEKPVYETRWGKLLAKTCAERMKAPAEALIFSFETEVFPAEAALDSTLPNLARAWLPHLKELAHPSSYTACREAIEYPPPKFTQKESSPKWKSYLKEVGQTLRKDFLTARGSLKTQDKDQYIALFSYTEDEWHTLLRDLGRLCLNLSRILGEFDRRYFAEGLRRRAFDFNQLERATYDLLVEGGERTRIAESIAECYDMVCVDEYQDVSPLQHAIFDAISRERNRFFVGDIKQSIYRFRHAEPEIFASLRRDYPRLSYDEATGAVGDLNSPDSDPMVSHFMSDNFRCDREIVRFINIVFSTLFGSAGESIGYRDDTDCLIYSKDPADTVLFPCPKVMIFDSPKGRDGAKADAAIGKDGLPLAKEVPDGTLPPESAENNTDEITQEAIWVAGEIHRLLTEETHHDGKTPLHPSDIVLLSRGVTGKTRQYVKALARYGIPVSVPDDQNFFLNPEVLLAVSLLEVIDNPLRDIPLAGVLCSPLYRLTPDHLAGIRRETPEGIPLYDALCAYCELHPDFTPGTQFLTQLSSFRETAEDTPVSHLIRRIYTETPLYNLAGVDGRPGDQNLKLLYHYACSFAGSDYQGLYGFLHYITRQSQRGSTFKTPAKDSSEDAVRIMSIHSSKGLEFPVVFVVNCGVPFSRLEEQEEILCDSRLGLSLRLRDLSGQLQVENPVHQLFVRTLRDKGREEEMRLFYVALTRARERLYITGSVAGSSMFDGVVSQRAEKAAACRDRRHTLDCSSYLEWVTQVHFANPGELDFTLVQEELSLPEGSDQTALPLQDPEEVAHLKAQLLRQFASTEAVTAPVRLPKKLAVSALYPRLLDGSEAEETVMELPDGMTSSPRDGIAFIPDAALTTPGDIQTAPDDAHEKYRRLPVAYAGEVPPDPTERGIATHLFLQYCNFRRLWEEGVEEETRRLVAEEYLSRETVALMRPEELNTFRLSHLMQELLRAKTVRREFRFHIFLPAEDFTSDPALREKLMGETLFIQGVIDALIEAPDGSLTLVDYKTDRLTREELAHPEKAAEKLLSRHKNQMQYYTAAVTRIFGRPPKAIYLYSLHAGTSFPVPL